MKPTTRLDRVATVRARVGWKALTADEYQDDGYAFLATPNIKSEVIDFQNVNFINRHRFEESPELKLAVGDVLLAKDGSTLGIANVVRDLPRESTVNGSIAVLRPTQIESRFLMYSLRSNAIQTVIQRMKDGMGVPHLFQADIRKFEIPNLRRGEQERIADFLDDQVVHIDKIVAARQRQIALLLTTLSSLIDSELTPTRAHPKLRLGLFILGIEQGWSPQCESVAADRDTWGVLKVSAVRSGNFAPDENKALPEHLEPALEYEVRPNDLLVTRANTPNLVGQFAVVPSDVRPKLIMCDKIMRLTVDKRLNPNYLSLFGQTSEVRSVLSGAGTGTSQSMVNIRGDDIRNLMIPLRDLASQLQLVARLADEKVHVNQAIAMYGQQVLLLTELKRSLITAAVTGEFDVSTADGSQVLAGASS